MIAWAIWENRNSLLNYCWCKFPEHVLNGVDAFLKEFLNSKQTISSDPPRHSSKLIPEWLVPSPGRLKLNSVVVFSNSSKVLGIRNDKGLVIAARSNQLQGSFNAVANELIALREGLRFALFYKISFDIVELSSSSVIFILNHPSSKCGDSKILVNDILAMFSLAGCNLDQVISKSEIP
ncbi:hypothetical protein Ddye_023991 [Dipteronia dyeriana]|uniref:RNase H type-1 domain-containing protein n=1 Tax=Dipteronia dyeriana TaxID=168575 RepID=A0AAD9WTS0_9ROSI|nr:hypothetical protein Ddye_023991 [Dipteronia dyeriana]